MRAECEAVVVRAELQAALEGSGPSISLIPSDIVRIAPWRGGLQFNTAAISADLKAVGRWSRVVEAPLALVAGIVAKSLGVTLVLVYSGNKLVLGRTMIDAREEASPLRFFQPGIEHQPELLEARADLRHLLDRPIKPRRRQSPVAGLPLFGSAAARD